MIPFSSRRAGDSGNPNLFSKWLFEANVPSQAFPLDDKIPLGWTTGTSPNLSGPILTLGLIIMPNKRTICKRKGNYHREYYNEDTFNWVIYSQETAYSLQLRTLKMKVTADLVSR